MDINSNIIFKTNIIPSIEQIIDVYKSSGIRRPISDKARIEKMYNYSNLIVTAWENDLLIGIARSLTDYCYCCYLSDLAVRKEYQRIGIGKKIIEIIQSIIGEETMLLLLSAPEAMEYYPKLGFKKAENAFIIPRNR